MKKRRLLLVQTRQFGYGAGYYHYCKYLPPSYEIHYLCYDQGLPYVKLDNVFVKYLQPRGEAKFMRNQLRMVVAIVKMLHSSEFDLCLFPCMRFNLLIRFFAPKPDKLILDIRSGSLASSSYKRCIDNMLFKVSVLCFSHSVTLSESMRRYLKLPLVKTGILPLGADMFKFGEKHYEPLKLLYIGTLNRRRIADTVYGFADFVERTSRGGTVKHTYDIIGTGSASEIDKLKSAIAETRMDNLIKYHGYKQYVEHEHFLSKCNTGVSYIPITAYYNHQPSTKTFEYILAGLICIGTGTCANKELINENNGVLCEDNAEGFSKALETLYEQRTKYDAHTVQETLKGYSWPNLVRNRVIPFFEEVMAATPAKR